MSRSKIVLICTFCLLFVFVLLVISQHKPTPGQSLVLLPNTGIIITPSPTTTILPTHTLGNNLPTFIDPKGGRFSFQHPSSFRISCGPAGCTAMSCDQIQDCDINNTDGSDDSYVFRITPIDSRMRTSEYERYKTTPPNSPFQEVGRTTVNGTTVVVRDGGLHRNVYVFNDNLGILFSGVGANHQKLIDIVNTVTFTTPL